MGLRTLVLRVALVACTLGAAAAQLKARCDSKCGNVSIPYPFGTREGCFRDPSFLITCNSSSGFPIPYLRKGNIRVLNISLHPAEMRVSTLVPYDCYYPNGTNHRRKSTLTLKKFAISNTKNKFYVVGCDTYACLIGNDFATGCVSVCSNLTHMTNGSCSGVGCCTTTFPQAIRNFNLSIGSYENHTHVLAFNPCSYAFVAEDGSFNFTTQDLLNLHKRPTSPVLLNWAVDNQTCAHARQNSSSYACKANSECYESEAGIGYLCRCKEGFKGNPYLSHPDSGCRDTNECATQKLCSMRCHNLDGNYTCSCPPGYKGDGYIHGSGCKFPFLEISLGISVALLVFFMLLSTLYWVHRQRTMKKLRRRYFEQNGGTMLQQFSQGQGYSERTRIFTENELKSATNNFDESRILGRGGQGTVYMGILPDKTLIAIKKSRVGGDPRQIKDFINEMAVLSQINHTNVVKILGCCLETEAPLLVYEFVDNGTLLDHIDPLKNEFSFSWETRLRIAAETAEAISYLHSYASIPIIHRDIKSANILLDHNLKAKVSDFGASRLVPLDETQVTTVVQGTLGYLDPEYLHTSQLNEKSDVYSFGVVLVELLTGNKVVEFNRPEQRNLAMYFVSLMKEDRLWEILDKRVLDQKNAEQLKEVAFLARRCVRVKGKERPTMKEVAMELQGMRAMEKHPWVKGEDPMSEESEYLLGHIPDGYEVASTSNSVANDSIQKQIASEIANGR
ncbi:wall-associated receptor kinase 2-like [Prosopis cineraria]|uniref:wall-associated receptor kinase 2-like n=1 Tax=Prosopis cineraria TaxID=364024 RepID=UPI00240F97B5|nr:wall-associated receptor kinase 2-like [Prosopis cineraria]